MPLQLEGEVAAPMRHSATTVLELTQAKQTFRFVNVGERPVPSLLRNFSAPVIVEHRYSDAELAFLSAHDSDGFNRWEAGQRLAIARLMSLTDAVEAGRPLAPRRAFRHACPRYAAGSALSPAFKAQALLCPPRASSANSAPSSIPKRFAPARRYAMRELGRRLAADWHATYASIAGSLPRAGGVFARRRVGRTGARCAIWRLTYLGGRRDRWRARARARAAGGIDQHDRCARCAVGDRQQRVAAEGRSADSAGALMERSAAVDEQVVSAAGDCDRASRRAAGRRSACDC